MKNRCDIWASLATDVARQCSVDATRDIAYVTGRVEKEGESFLKTSLPNFAKDLELSLDSFAVPAHLFAGFHRRDRLITVHTKGKKMRHGLPLFLGSFMEQIFHDSYDVSLAEYLELQSLSEADGVPLSFRFAPIIKTVGSDEDRERMANAIAAVRQLCLAFGKEKELCSDSKTEDAVKKYKACDEELMLPFTTDA
jgi:hypothetical protein